MISALTKKIRAFLQRRKNRLSPKEVERLRAMVREKNLKHVALLIDGHRRWSKRNGLEIKDGYDKIMEVLPIVLKHGYSLNIHTITVWLLTSSNVVKRSSDELDLIYPRCEQLVDIFVALAGMFKIKLVHVGRKDRIPASLKNKLEQAEEATAFFEEHILNMALDYGAKDEFIQVAQKIVQIHTSIDAITEKTIDKLMYTGNQPHPSPDLIIRPGRVSRLSGFMSWHSGFSELYFSEVFFPDFTLADFNKALYAFDSRNRRYGG